MRQSSCGRVDGLAKSGFQSSHGVPDYRDGEVLFATKAMANHYRENGILLAARRLTWALTESISVKTRDILHRWQRRDTAKRRLVPVLSQLEGVAGGSHSAFGPWCAFVVFC